LRKLILKYSRRKKERPWPTPGFEPSKDITTLLTKVLTEIGGKSPVAMIKGGKRKGGAEGKPQKNSTPSTVE